MYHVLRFTSECKEATRGERTWRRKAMFYTTCSNDSKTFQHDECDLWQWHLSITAETFWSILPSILCLRHSYKRTLGHWSQTQFLEGHSSNPNQTHLIQLIRVFRITRNVQSVVIWSWLELNCAELWPSRNWVWDQCLRGTTTPYNPLHLFLVCSERRLMRMRCLHLPGWDPAWGRCSSRVNGGNSSLTGPLLLSIFTHSKQQTDRHSWTPKLSLKRKGLCSCLGMFSTCLKFWGSNYVRNVVLSRPRV